MNGPSEMLIEGHERPEKLKKDFPFFFRVNNSCANEAIVALTQRFGEEANWIADGQPKTNYHNPGAFWDIYWSDDVCLVFFREGNNDVLEMKLRFG